MQQKKILLISAGLAIFVSGIYPHLISNTFYNCSGVFGIGSKLYGYLGFLAITLFVYSYYKNISKKSFISEVSSGFVIGGGLYNSLFRSLYGCVADYFILWDLKYNLADIIVCVGLIILFCYNFYTDGRNKEQTHNFDSRR